MTKYLAVKKVNLTKGVLALNHSLYKSNYMMWLSASEILGHNDPDIKMTWMKAIFIL